MYPRHNREGVAGLRLMTVEEMEDIGEILAPAGLVRHGGDLAPIEGDPVQDVWVVGRIEQIPRFEDGHVFPELFLPTNKIHPRTSPESR